MGDGGGGGGDFFSGGGGGGGKSSSDAGGGMPFSDGGTGDYGTSAGPGSMNFGAGDMSSIFSGSPSFAPQAITGGDTQTGTNVGGAQSNQPSTGNAPQAATPPPQQQDQVPLPRPRPPEAPGAGGPSSFQLGSAPQVPGPTGPTAAQADPLGAFATQNTNDLNALVAQQQRAALGGTPAGDQLGQFAQQSQPQPSQQPQAQAPVTAGTAPTDQTAGPAASDTGADESATNQQPPSQPQQPDQSQAPASKGGGAASQGGGGASNQGPGASRGGGAPNINPMQILQSLLQRGPMGALQTLAQQAMGGAGGLPYTAQGGQSPFGGGGEYQWPQQRAPVSSPTGAGTGAAPPFPPQPPMPGQTPTPEQQQQQQTWQQGVQGQQQQWAAQNERAAASNPNVAQQRSSYIARQPASTHGQNFGQPYNQQLASDRQRYAQTLQQNPALKAKIMRIMYNEQGANPQGTQAVAESMLNRASVRGQSLEQVSRWHGSERGGYYQMGNMGRGALENPRTRALLETSLNNALRGSNISNFATDNSSGSLAAGERSSGRFNYQANFHGETFFSPGHAERGYVPMWQRWAGQMLGAQ